MARQEKSLAVCLEILQDYTAKDFSLFAVLTTADFYLWVDTTWDLLFISILSHIIRLLVYVRCYKIDNWNDSIKGTRQEKPKKDLHPTIRQPYTFIPWHHIRHIIEMASEDFFVFLSVVFKKFGLVFNAENGGYPPTQNGDIRSLFWLFSLMALQN